MSGTDTTPEVLPGDPGNGGASGTTPEALTLEEINAQLGKQFPTKDAALKALKDTFVFAVTKEEKIAEKVRSELASSFKADELAKEVSELKKNSFYDKNPQYAEFRGVIDKLGSNPAEVVATDSFKDIFGKAQEGVKAQKARTVLDSNPRLGKAIDSMTEAREAVKTDFGKAQNLAVESVLEAFNLRN